MELQTYTVSAEPEAGPANLECLSPGMAIEYYLAYHGMMHYDHMSCVPTIDPPDDGYDHASIMRTFSAPNNYTQEEHAMMLDNHHFWKEKPRNLYYTGVGSRNTPQDIQAIMTKIALGLRMAGYVLRSGGAEGADKAFELGARDKKEIYYANDATEPAMDMAARFHPAWGACSDYAKKLHGRNSFQVLGRNLDTPSGALICWTPDGCIQHARRKIETGGTGTAISIANHFGCRITNLQRPEHLKRWTDWLKQYWKLM